MSIDLIFNKQEAESKGVVFTPVYKRIPVCRCGMGIDSPECECEYHSQNWMNVQFGQTIECPDGSEGFAITESLFQCKNINQEIKSWFMLNLKKVELSF